MLAETGLVVEYLFDHHGKWLIPKDIIQGKEDQFGGETEEWIRHRYYMHYAEGSLMPYIITEFILHSKSLSEIQGAMLILKSLGFKLFSPFFINPVVNLIVRAVEKNCLEPNLESTFRLS